MANKNHHDPEASKPLRAAGNAAIYTRAATAEKQLQKSTAQTADLLLFAQQLGFSDDHIIVFDQDNGKPANAAITGREGRKALVTAIEQGVIKAVFVSHLYRLFRDATGIQASIFLHLGEEQSVCIVTPETTYDLPDSFRHGKEE